MSARASCWPLVVVTAAELWEGFVKMLDAPAFFELKRTRTHAPTLVDESVLDAQLSS